MTGLIIYLLGCIGATFIITFGDIFDWLRDLLKPYKLFYTLFTCPLCMGFWVGVVMYFIVGYTFEPGRLFACACASSALSQIAYSKL